MEHNNAPYAPPKADLEEQISLPSGYQTSDITAAKLRFCGWLSVIYTILLVPTFVISFMSGLSEGSDQYDVLSFLFEIVGLVIWVYCFLVLKKFVRMRFEYNKANIYFNLIILFSVFMTVLSALTVFGPEELGVLFIANFVMLFILGVLSILLGRAMLKIPQQYRYLKAFGWVNIVIGICLVSIILIIVAVPFSIASSVFMALLFFHAAGERGKTEGA